MTNAFTLLSETNSETEDPLHRAVHLGDGASSSPSKRHQDSGGNGWLEAQTPTMPTGAAGLEKAVSEISHQGKV